MHPLVFFGVMVLLTALAWGGHKLVRRAQVRQLRRLAADWRMRFAEKDLFHLARRIARQFPIADVTDVRVCDVIYGSHNVCHRYVFTAAYTLGPLDRHRREARVMTVCEAIEVRPDRRLLPPLVAPENLSLVEQYRHFERAEAHCRHCPR